MTCENANILSNTGKIKNFFYKIMLETPSNNILDNNSNEILFDTFVPYDMPLPEPLSQLSEINVSFYTPDGDLYDFNGKDHSYLLEISTIRNKPKRTTIDINTGTVT